AVTNMAISYIDNTEYKIFLDFPGCNSFEVITKISISRDSDKAAQKIIDIAINYFKILTLLKPTHVIAFDVKDQLLLYSYDNLLDFITDFQKTHSSKPTKNMLAEIRNWDPSFNFNQALSKEYI
ncbi:hypothetical protein FQN55_004253, partial [Onygenales sp. PD_40]